MEPLSHGTEIRLDSQPGHVVGREQPEANEFRETIPMLTCRSMVNADGL
jgi:hypothetical protein